MGKRGRKLDDMSGKVIGIFKVLSFHHMAQNGKDGTHGMSYYLCECTKCGKRAYYSKKRISTAKVQTSQKQM